MAFSTGVFNTTINPAELNVRSFAGTMLRLFPNGSFPLWGLLSQQPRAQAKNFAHGYFSKTFLFGSVVVNGALVAGEAAIVVDSTTGILPFMVLYNPLTRENMRVVTVDSAVQITVTRSFGRVATANIADNQALIVVGSAFAEGSDRPTARRITTVHIPNYTQIFRNAWAVTDTARASLTEAGFGNVQEDRRDCAMMHSVEAESAIFFGQAELDVAGAQPIHTTQGIYDAADQYAPTHTNTAGATTTFDELVALVDPAFQFSTDMGNAKERVGFVGSTALKVLNDIGRMSGQVTILQDETSFGMQFTSFKFYRGKINLIHHPLFDGLPELASLMVIVDLSALKLAFMNGRDTKAEEYGGDGKNNANGVDAVGGSLTSEFAVELINPFACAIVEGLTAAAA
jgi:hypothetical protein